MSPSLFFNNKKYLSAKEASVLTGYSRDYIGQLARGGKVESKKVGRVWYVEEESLLKHKNLSLELTALSSPGIVVSDSPLPTENTKTEQPKTVAQNITPSVEPHQPKAPLAYSLEKYQILKKAEKDVPPTVHKKLSSKPSVFHRKPVSMILRLATVVAIVSFSVPSFADFFRNVDTVSRNLQASLISSLTASREATTKLATNVTVDEVQSFWGNYLVTEEELTSAVTSNISVDTVLLGWKDYLSNQNKKTNLTLTPKPASVSQKKTSTTPTIVYNNNVSQASLVSALRTLITNGVPDDILAQLRGPQGLKGEPGQTIVTNTPAPIPIAPASFGIIAPSPVSNPNQFSGALVVGGLDIGARHVNTGELVVTGNTSLGNLSVSGNTNLTGPISVGGDTALSGNLSVAGDATVSGAFTVTGDFNLGLTEGSVAFQGADGVTQDNANFFWDDATNRLGLGINTPTQTLDVAGTMTTLGSTTLATGAGTTNTFGSGESSINIIGSTTTPGALTLHGETTLDNNFIQDGAFTFSTGTGAVSLNGNTSVTGTNTFTVGTGLTTLGGDFSQTGATTFSTGTGIFTFNNPTINLAADGTVIDLTDADSTLAINTVTNRPITTGTGLTTLGGDLTVIGTAWTATPTISGLITATSGLTSNGAFTLQNDSNFSQTGTGTFSTGTGAVSLNGNTSVTGTNTFTVGTGLTTLGGNLTIEGTSIDLAENSTINQASGTLNVNTTNNRPVTFGTGLVTIPNLHITNQETSIGLMSIDSATETGTIIQVTGNSLTSGTAIGKTLTANAGNGQVTTGEQVTLTDSTTGGGGFTGIGISVTGAGTGSGNKYLLSLEPNTANNQVVFDNTGAFRPTTSVASNTATIGSPSFYWKNGYFDQITANNIAGTVVSGATSSTTWTIGSTEAGDVNEAIIFQRNSGSGNAIFQWNAGASDLRYLSVNYPFNSTYTVNDASIGTGVNLYSGNLTNNTTSGTQRLLSLVNSGTGTTETGIYINNTGTAVTAFEIAGTWTNGIITNNNSINAGTGTVTGGDATFSNVTNSALTSGRVTFAGTAGMLADDADLTFATDTLTATKLLAPTSVSTPSLISTGAIDITPLAGTNLNINLSTTGDFSVNTNQLYVDTSAGNVGIGTTAPAAKLELAGAHVVNRGLLYVNGTDYSFAGFEAPAAGQAGVFFNRGGTPEWIVGMAGSNASTDALYFSEGANLTSGARMTLLAGGNLGIGTTTPGAKLDVVGEISSSVTGFSDGGTGLVISGSNTSRTSAPSNTSSSYIITTASSGGSYPFDNFGNLVLQPRTSAARDIVFMSGTTAPSVRMVINSSGNVGIGTTSPTALLQTYTTASTYGNLAIIGGRLNGEDGAALLVNPNIQTTVLRTDIAGVKIQPSVTNNLAGVEVTNYRGLYIAAPTSDGTFTTAYGLYIDAPTLGGTNIAGYFGGNVGIGTTTPGARLHVSGGDVYLDVNRKVAWDSGTEYIYRPTGVDEIRIGTQSADKVTIQGSGNVGIGTTIPAQKLHISSGAVNNSAVSFTTDATGHSSTDGLWIGYSTRSAIWNYENTALAFATNNTERWQIDSSGHFIASTDNTYDIGASGATRPRTAYLGTSLVLGSGGSLRSGTDGVITMTNAAGTAFTKLNFGGTTSSFPALVRSGAGLLLSRADDSGYTSLQAGPLYSQGGVSVTSTTQFRFSSGGDASASLDTGIGRSAAGNINFTNGSSTNYWTIGSGGIQAGTDNTYDIGASGATRPRNVYVGTSVVTPSLTVSGLTPDRIPFVTTGGLLTDSANLTFNGSAMVGATTLDFNASPTVATTDSTPFNHLSGYVFRSTATDVPSTVTQNGGFFELTLTPSGSISGKTSSALRASSVIPSSNTQAIGATFGLIAQTANDSTSGTTVSTNGLYAGASYSGEGTGTAVRGVWALAQASSSSSVGSLDGFNTIVSASGSAAVTTRLSGLTVNSWGNTGSGTIANLYGVNIANMSNSGGGTITNTYGVYIGDMTAGTQTNQAYSFYASDTGALNYFAGNVGIGNTAPETELHVGNNVDADDKEIRIQSLTTQNAILNFKKGATSEWSVYVPANSDSLRINENGVSDVMTFLAGGNVGIGITNPGTALTLDKGADTRLTVNNAGSARVLLGDNNGGNLILYNTSALQQTNLSSSGSSFIAAQTGNLSIGTTTAFSKLTVQGSSGSGIIDVTSGDTTLNHGDIIGQYGFRSIDADGHVGGDQLVGYVAGVVNDNGGDNIFAGSAAEGFDLAFYTSLRPSSNALLTVSERMRIDKNGNVGIGTTSPNIEGNTKGLTISAGTSGDVKAGIELQGFRTTDVSYAAINAYHGGSNNAQISFIRAGANDAANIAFLTRTTGGSITERMRIDTNGNVGIGTTSMIGGGVRLQLHNVDSSQTQQYFTNNDTGVTSNDGFRVGLGSSQTAIVWNNENTALRFATNNSEKVRITETGNVGIGTTNPSTFKLQVAGSIGPDSNDGGALGASSRAFSDLFLASGGVVNFNDDVYLTHSADLLTLSSSSFTVANGNLTLSAGSIYLSSSGEQIGRNSTSGYIPYHTSYGGAINTYKSFYINIDSDNDDVDTQSFTIAKNSTANGGTSLFTVLEGGNVGIGTTSPAAKLQIAGTTHMGGVGVDGTFRLYDASAGGTGSYINFANSAGVLTITGGNGSASTNNEVRISGDLRPSNDDARALGSTSLRWNYLRVGTGASSFEGNVAIGTTAITGRGKFEVATTNTSDGNMTLSSYSDYGPYTPYLDFNRSANNTIGSHTVVQADHVLGKLLFRGSDGTQFRTGAGIIAEVDGAVTGGGVADMPGRLSFYTTPDGSATVAERMRITNAGSVGIGVTNPNGRLNVQSSAQSTYPINVDYADGTDGGGFYESGTTGLSLILKNASATQTAQVASAGVSYFNGGNVGIGTTNPGAPLDIVKSASGTVFQATTSADGSSADYIFGAGVSGNVSSSQGTIILADRGTSYWGIRKNFTTHNFTIRDMDGATVPFTIENGTPSNALYLQATTGNVGIGTTNPSTKLNVFGTIRASTGDHQFELYQGDNTTLVGRLTYTAQILRVQGSTGIRFQDADTSAEWMAIDSSGNVGIGTTTPTHKLDVNGAIKTYGQNTIHTTSALVLSQESSTKSQIRAYGADATTAGTLEFVMSANDGSPSAIAMTILDSGNVGIGTTNPIEALVIRRSSADAGIRVDTMTSGVASLALLGYGSNTTPGVAGGGIINLSNRTVTNNNYSVIAAQNSGGANIGAINFINVDHATNDGAMAFLTRPASGSLTERMRILGNGNVGIGTTNPGASLDIDSSATSFEGSVRIHSRASSAENGDWGLYARNNPYFSIEDINAGTKPLVILPTTGNVGIGTTSPRSRLQITNLLNSTTLGSGEVLRISAEDGNTLNARNEISFTSAGTTGPDAVIGGLRTNATGFGYSDLYFATRAASANAAPVERMRIAAVTGNVGIGTTNPGDALHVVKNTDMGVTIESTSASGNARLNLKNSAGTVPFDWVLQGQQLTGAFRIRDNAAGLDRVTILSSGNVGIGTTDPSAARLMVRSSGATASTTGLIVEDSSGADYLVAKDNGTLTVGKNFTVTDSATYFAIGNSSMTLTNNSGGNRSGTSAGVHYAMTIANVAGNESFSNATGASFNLDSRNTASGNVITGVSGSVRLGNATGRADTMTGGSFSANTNDATGGTVITLSGVTSSATVNNAGVTATNAYGLNISGITNLGTITNTYGLYIGDVTSGTQSNTAYSIYAADTNARIYLGGQVQTGSNIILGGSSSYIGVDGSNNYTPFHGTYGASANTHESFYVNIDSDNNDADTTAFIIAKNAANSSGTELFRVTEAGNVGIGTTSPSSKLDVTTAGLGVTQTTSSGLALVNTTAAAAGAQQISPAIRWSGFGWKTDATAASQAVDFRAFVTPVQGTANPTGYLGFGSSINGGAYNDNQLVLTSAGNVGIGTTNPNATLTFGTSPTINSATSRIEQIDGATVATWATAVIDEAPSGYGAIPFLEVIGTLPDPGNTRTTFGSRFVFGGSGTGTKKNIGMQVTLADGYAGSSDSFGLEVNNNTSAASALPIGLNVSVDNGSTNLSPFTLGIWSTAKQGTEKSVSIWGDGTGDGVTQIGVVGTANNGTTANIGGYFALGGEAPHTFDFPAIGASSALVVTNSTVAANIATFYDNTTPVFSIIDGGNVGIGTTNPGAKLDVIDNTIGSNTYAQFGPTTIDASTRAGGLKLFGTAGSTDFTWGLYNRANGRLSIEFLGARATAWDTAPALSILSSGNVGIGTTTPASSLHVAGGVLTLGLIDTASGHINSPELMTFNIDTDNDDADTRYFAWYKNGGAGAGTELMRLNEAGKVGIGTTGPGYSLEIHDSTNSPVFALSDDDVSHPITSFYQANVFGAFTSLSTTAGGLSVGGLSDAASTSGLYLSGVIGAADPDDATPAIILNTFKSNGATSIAALGSSETALQVQNSSTALMTVLGSGNVGIGTTSPLTKVDVYGTNAVTSSRGNLMVRTSDAFGQNVGGQITLGGVASTGNIGNFGTIAGRAEDSVATLRGYLAFGTSDVGGTNAEKMRITSAGNVGIGITNPNSRLDVNGFATLGTGTGTGQTSTAFHRIRGTAITDAGVNWYGIYGGLLLDANSAYTSTARKFLITNAFESNKFAIIRSADVSTDPALGNQGALTSGTADFVINNSGYVGIGTTAPNVKLDILGADNVSSRVRVAKTGAGTIQIGADRDTYASPFIETVSNSHLDFFTNATHAMRISNTGNVGIGTTNPTTARLAVSGGTVNSIATIAASFTASANAVHIGDDGTDGVIGIGNSSTKLHLLSRVAGVYTRSFTLDSAGNVGIGTISPSTTLDVVGSGIRLSDVSTDATNKISLLLNRHYTNTEEDFILIRGKASSAANKIDIGGGQGSYNVATDISFFTAANTTTVTGTERMKIGSTGAITLTGPSNNGWVQTPGSQIFMIDSDNNASGEGFYFRKDADGSGGTDLMQILESGNVLIGATSYDFGKVDITTTPGSGYSGGLGVGFRSNVTEGDSTGISFKTKISLSGSIWENARIAAVTHSVGSSVYGDLVFYTMNATTLAERMRVDNVGNLSVSSLISCGGIQTNGSGVMSCTSDETLKDVVGTFSSGLESVRVINPQVYSWKADSGLFDDGVLYYGFIAQNVQQAIPEAVNTGANGKLQINTTTILAASINAIKELDLTLNGIGDRVTALENQINNGGMIGNLGQYATAFFEQGIKSVTDGVVYMRALVVESLKVGSPTKRTGITLYDELTGEPYCISIANGIAKTTLGDCITYGADPQGLNVVPPPEPEGEGIVESCTDGIQNQDETGIDEGGVCTPEEVIPEDTTAPVITLNGNAEINLTVGDTYIEEGATATDDTDEVVDVVLNGIINTNIAGVYTITYNATDTAGNNAVEVTRSVVVSEVVEEGE